MNPWIYDDGTDFDLTFTERIFYNLILIQEIFQALLYLIL